MTRNWGLSRSQQQHDGNCEQQDRGGNNFGIFEHRALSNETSRKAVGENQPSGSLCGADTTRPANVFRLTDYPPGQVNSERLTAAPSFIDDADREFAVYVFLLMFIGCPSLFLGALYLLFVD